ncbi:hypothetical protein ACSBR1_032725 [Camellia fascicularis]
MKFIKNRLRNRMGDQWLNDCLVTYIEKDVFDSVDNELIMQRFQNMKSRRGVEVKSFNGFWVDGSSRYIFLLDRGLGSKDTFKGRLLCFNE